MFTIVTTCVVPLRQEDVFGFLADFRNAPSWQPQLETVSLPDGPFPAGRQVIEVHRMAGLRVDAVGTLIDWHPPKTFTVRGGSGLLTVQSRYLFDAVGPDTEVRLELTLSTRGPARLAEPMLRFRMTRDLTASFRRLEQILLATVGPGGKGE